MNFGGRFSVTSFFIVFAREACRQQKLVSLARLLGTDADVLQLDEQRMVSLAMASMRKRLLLPHDEPSLGLSPAIVEQVMSRVRELLTTAMSVILVEQNIPAALSVASHVCVLRPGRVILEDGPDAGAHTTAAAYSLAPLEGPQADRDLPC